MKNGIGICGCHRSGKSTLMKAFGEAFEMRVIEVNVGEVYQKLNLSPKETYPFDIRMKIQWATLSHAVDKYKEAGIEPFVTDRTPLDFIAYTMADVGKENVTDLTGDLMDYVKACFATLNDHFMVTVRVQPGIPLIEAPTSAPANLAFMEHIDLLIAGLGSSDLNNVKSVRIPREVLNLNQRIRAVEQAVILARKTLDQTFSKGNVLLPQQSTLIH